MLPPRRYSAQRGFTLLELLVVISLIAFLIAVLLLGGSHLIQRAKIAGTRSALAQISIAMQRYQSQHGSFPGMEAGKFTEKWPVDYDSHGVEFELALLAGIDLNLPDANLDKDRQYALDNWGRRLRYRRSSPETIMVWSVGPDKIDQTGDKGPLNNEAIGDDLATH